jgi:hypothetical protein
VLPMLTTTAAAQLPLLEPEGERGVIPLLKKRRGSPRSGGGGDRSKPTCFQEEEMVLRITKANSYRSQLGLISDGLTRVLPI